MGSVFPVTVVSALVTELLSAGEAISRNSCASVGVVVAGAVVVASVVVTSFAVVWEPQLIIAMVRATTSRQIKTLGKLSFINNFLLLEIMRLSIYIIKLHYNSYKLIKQL
jgi:hypothetical protein